jgi:hypothetical protein
MMELSKIEKRVLAAIQKWGSMTASMLGEELWGTGTRHCQHYARPAGKVLSQMKKKGLVQDSFHISGRRRWALTRERTDAK